MAQMTVDETITGVPNFFKPQVFSKFKQEKGEREDMLRLLRNYKVPQLLFSVKYSSEQGEEEVRGTVTMQGLKLPEVR